MIRLRPWALLSLALFCLCAARAEAHPLGNFSINHLVRVTPGRDGLHLVYALDIAEIPTFQIMHPSGLPWDANRLRLWATAEARTITEALAVTVDGQVQLLVAHNPQARLRAGAGGLPTLYWTAAFDIPLAARQSHNVTVVDRAYANRRVGWRDVVVAPQSDPTGALSHYPNALIGSPRQNDRAQFVVTPAGAATQIVVGSNALEDGAPGTSILARTGYLADLFALPNQTPWAIFLTILIAFGLGALHGLEPGHGKALLAFTLVGARATIGQAGILALSLTFAHTIAVLLLGLLLFFAAGFASESIFGWITLVSGAAVAIIGARSLNAAIAHAGPDRAHEHAHAIAGSQPLRFGSAVIAAMSGGIAPCPAAIVVLLTALRLDRVGYGLALIVVFSLGLAAVLSGLGIAVVHGASWLRRQARFDRAMRFSPIVTAVIISIAGAVMLGQGFVAQGIAGSVALVAGLTLAAIVGFAFVPHHDHGDTQIA